ncbi:DUF302 domain-containing protein [Sulfurimonas sp. HSL-3221]|uniref:DUF302 domain-containing protein n=1 Tax=Thiomicrolovo sulfuroxydans TaxID=2894755 RepID=UPI001E4C94B2|nr:DUF302 domain-containing protein [Sulfurimonas sp. HSL-3221]UFS63273.1 DUF302 domain-containing protein [Sulfurimonas sp. HSL-3221]
MMKHILFLLFSTVIALHAQGDLRIFSVDNDPKSDLPQVIERSLAANGFTIAANTEMNKPFNIQFQQSDFDVFYLLTAYHTDLSRTLVVKYPDAGIFVPMGFGIYQHKGEKQLHVSVLTAEAMAKIIGLRSVDPILKKIEAAALKALESAMPKASVAIENENPLPASGPLVSTYSLEVEEDEYDDVKEELAMGIQGGLSPKGFVLSNTLDFEMVVGEDESIDNPFDFYDTYSICKLKVIYNVAKTRPQASAFAPCTMMMYKKKGDDKIVIGFPGVYNWMSSARVQDDEAKAELMKAQNDFETLLGDLTE